MSRAVTVSQINRYIANLFKQDYTLSGIQVKGEISGCKYHYSGHIYFTLKDAGAAISCVMFSSQRKGLDFTLEDGQSVIVTGQISVFERDGRYQLYARSIAQDGVGRLYEEYEKLKKRLLAEGLFDEQRKKPIPRYASKIGVVTAETGAVIQDICNVTYRRNPYVQLYLYPAKVQGEGAAQTVIEGIHYFEQTVVDTIIIGRGGGSVEDLWCFNDEVLARVIADCTKPIISAVGHETDTTISDYAADLRAPTPSAAAELAVYSWREMEIGLREYRNDLRQAMHQILKVRKLELQKYMVLLQHVSPEDILRQKRLVLADSQERLQRLMEKRLTDAKHRLALYAEEMKGLSPLQKLQSGYTYTADEAGNHIDSVQSLEKGQHLTLTFADGQADVTVDEIRE
ncbi:exodeoxyribonuclease VII large subunit [Roseburia sp. AM59-24XD]|jgi:exodeoxyribonuclease VII large subunit|uniref:exodeoxyribonuclease VII large subunit n=1 Tax=Roseburia sp. AM59-24XD TaxID=2293138 RepID=UPI000E520E4E|nr:exodeoxyribonuclease VII large subunit [Roseburia sp. AM59-24XD]RHP85782.1 exodeoxyribonuclease VII large subunit [Roseburia sp. AM59-24XD]